MDPVTHAALGAACSQVLLYKYDKRNAWIAGALGGIAPDLDIFIRSSSDPFLLLLYHRHFTHSLLFIPLGGPLVGLALLLFSRFRKHKWLTFFAATIGYGTHALLDSTTSYGTLLFWPFSMQRIAWDWIAIIDPFFTVPIILGLVWTQQFKTIKGTLCGLGIAALFMIFCIVQHERAVIAARYFWENKQIQIEKVRAFPILGTSSYLRTVSNSAQNWYIADAYVPLLQESEIRELGTYPIFTISQLPRFVEGKGLQLRDFNIFYWFTQGYVAAASSAPLVLVDVRYVAGIKPLIALWGIKLIPDEKHAQFISAIPLGESK